MAIYIYIFCAVNITIVSIFIWTLVRNKNPESTLFTGIPSFGFGLSRIFGSSDKQEIISKLESALLSADVGIKTTQFLVQSLLNAPQTTSDELKQKLREDMLQIFTSTPKFSTSDCIAHKPFVLFMVGVNGTGKTTTSGKLASFFSKQNFKVTLVAADTFRAAAAEQLAIWSERAGVNLVRGQDGADPASVVFTGIQSAKAKSSDVVIVDTAGRLQNKQNLMEEMKKMGRVAQKELGRDIDQAWLVLDAHVGQNGISQAQGFLEAAHINGVVLTKCDSTAKGGIVLAIAHEWNLPVHFIGTGEKMEDLQAFDAHEFVDRILEE